MKSSQFKTRVPQRTPLFQGRPKLALAYVYLPLHNPEIRETNSKDETNTEKDVFAGPKCTNNN